MRNRDLKKADWWRWGHGSAATATVGGSRRPVQCKRCGELIYWVQRDDGRWLPFESWVGGRVEEGEWRLHDCTG